MYRVDFNSEYVLSRILSDFSTSEAVLKKDTGQFFTEDVILLNILIKYVDFTRKYFTLLDPSCGIGDILLHSIKKYMDSWKTKLPERELISNIFRNFYGYDINPNACLAAKYRIFTLIKSEFGNVVNNFDFNNLNIFSLDFTIKENLRNSYNYFDYIVSNPPYITYYGKHAKRITQEKKKYYISKYNFIENKNKDNRLNSSMFFIENSLELLRKNAIACFILDISFFEPPYRQIRKFILNNSSILEIFDNIEKFEGVFSGQIILTLKKLNNPNNVIKWINFQTQERKQNVYEMDRDYRFTKPKNKFDIYLIEKIKKDSLPLSYFLGKREIRTCAVLTGKTKQFVFNAVDNNSSNNFYPFLEGSKGLPERFTITENGKLLEYNYEKQIKISNEFKKELEKQGVKNKKRIGLGDELAYRNPKIFIRQSAKKLICAYTEKPMSANNSIYVIFKKEDTSENRKFLKYLTSLLNSEILTFFALQENIIRIQKGKIPQIRLSDLYNLPIKVKIVDNIIRYGGKRDFERLNKEVAKIYDISDDELEYIVAQNNRSNLEE